MSDPILLSQVKGVSTLTLNRPKAMNSLDFEMMGALVEATRTLAAQQDLRCVVIKGTGDNFMAGGDLKAFTQLFPMPPDERRNHCEKMVNDLHESIETLNALDAPVIACVRGACAGFGLSLVAGCDLSIASDSAYFATAYRSIGLTPDGGGTYFLQRAIGMRRAMELFLLSPRFSAQHAKEIGLINQVVPAAQLEAALEAMVYQISSGPKRAMGNLKQLIYASESNSLVEQLREEAQSFAECAAHDDFVEGVSAFIEKRNPRFLD